MIEIQSLDKFMHIKSRRVFTYICRDFEDQSIIILYDNELQKAVQVPESKFFKNYYNVTPEVHND
jgi:hypothetical protein